MEARWIGAAIGLIGGQIAGRVLAAFLSSSAGERFLERVDGSALTPLEQRVLAERWAGSIGTAISAAAATLFFVAGSVRRGQGPSGEPGVVGEHTLDGPATRKIDLVQVMQRVAEVMLALGAILKVVGQYLEDRQRTAAESERMAAKRLA